VSALRERLLSQKSLSEHEKVSRRVVDLFLSSKNPTTTTPTTERDEDEEEEEQ
jgi:hypothetical protein